MRRTNMTRPGPCPHWEKKGSKFNSWRCQAYSIDMCSRATAKSTVSPCYSKSNSNLTMCFLALFFFGVPNCCRFDKLAARNLAKTGRLRMTRQSSQPIEFANSSHTKHTRRSIVKSTCSKFCKSNMPAHVCKIGIPMIIMGVSFTINLSLMRPPPSFWPCQWAGSNKWKDLRWLRIPRS